MTKKNKRNARSREESAAPDEQVIEATPPAETTDESIASVEPDDAVEPLDTPDEETPLEAVVEEIDFAPQEDDEEPESEPSEVEEEEALVDEMPEAQLFRTPDELKSAVEALLFTTTHPLSLARLKTILGNIDPKTLRGAIVQLQTEYDARSTGLQIVEGAEGYVMCTRPEYANVILRLHRERKRNPLTVTALETLSIVAYKQPVTRAEIEMIRGVESSGVLRNLCDMGMVKVVGRKEVIGRPQLYGTTSVFLKTFGLKSIEELPTLQTLRRRFGSQPSIADAMEQHTEGSSGPQEVTPVDEIPAGDLAETEAESEPPVTDPSVGDDSP